MCLFEEGIQQTKEASEIYERLSDTVQQAWCLIDLAWLLHDDGQFDTAENAASRVIDLFLENCEQCHHLGIIWNSKDETKKATHHSKAAPGTTPPPNWPNMLFWIRYSLADPFSDEDRLDDANAHIELVKLHAANGNDTYLLARAMELQAGFLHRQRRFEEAESEALDAVDAFEKLGAANDAEDARTLLQWIDRDTRRIGSGSC